MAEAHARTVGARVRGGGPWKDERAVSAISRRDQAALAALLIPGLPKTFRIEELSESECIGDVIAFERDGDELLARHVLGFNELGSHCQGAHELRLTFRKRTSEGPLQLSGAHRWGW